MSNGVLAAVHHPAAPQLARLDPAAEDHSGVFDRQICEQVVELGLGR